jgi:hypothetical protein
MKMKRLVKKKRIWKRNLILSKKVSRLFGGEPVGGKLLPQKFSILFKPMKSIIQIEMEYLEWIEENFLKERLREIAARFARKFDLLPYQEVLKFETFMIY